MTADQAKLMELAFSNTPMLEYRELAERVARSNAAIFYSRLNVWRDDVNTSRSTLNMREEAK